MELHKCYMNFLSCLPASAEIVVMKMNMVLRTRKCSRSGSCQEWNAKVNWNRVFARYERALNREAGSVLTFHKWSSVLYVRVQDERFCDDIEDVSQSSGLWRVFGRGEVGGSQGRNGVGISMKVRGGLVAAALHWE